MANNVDIGGLHSVFPHEQVDEFGHVSSDQADIGAGLCVWRKITESY